MIRSTLGAAPEPTFPGCVVRCRAIGMFLLRDEAGPDEKVICVMSTDPRYEQVRDLHHLPDFQREEIEHFFFIYKDVEPGKSVEKIRWANRPKPKRRSPTRSAGPGRSQGRGQASRRRPRKAKGLVKAAGVTRLHGLSCGVLSELAEVADPADRARVDELLRRLDADVFRVLVAGEAKRGKSTLINALLGQEVLPTGVVPLTAIPTTVAHGPARN